MADRHVPALAMACLLVLSGCSALGGGGSATDPTGTAPSTAATPATTGAPTPTTTSGTPTTTASGADATTTAGPSPPYPPGLSADGVVDAAALATAHAETLRGGPYRTFRGTVVETAPSGGTAPDDDGFSAWLAERVTVWDDGSRYQYHRTREGGPVQTSVVTSIYADGSVAYRKQLVEYGQRNPLRETITHDRLTYPDGSPVPPVAVPHGDPPGEGRIALLFGRLDDVSTERFENGTVRVRAESIAGDRLAVGDYVLTNVTAFEFTATVAPSGVVRAYRLHAAGTADGDRVRADQWFGAGELPSAPGSPPEWYVRARLNESVTFEPTNGTPAVAGGPAPPAATDYGDPGVDFAHAARSATSASPTLPGRRYSAGVGWPSPGISRWFSGG